MKKLYFDSNYLFRLYSTEPGAEQAQALAQKADTVATAWHGRAELASILLRKRRENAFSMGIVHEIFQQMRDDVATGFVTFLPLTEAVMVRLESVLLAASSPSTASLRATDALHLACAAEHGFTEVYSNDRHFLTVAPLFGMRGINVIGEPKP